MDTKSTTNFAEKGALNYTNEIIKKIFFLKGILH